VARDALDQATGIVRDAASLGALEAKRVAREVGPRVAMGVGLGLLTAVLGATGFVLAVIALFDLLAGAVPSTAGRLAILAAGFALVAGLCAVLTARGLRRVTEPGPHARVRETMPTGRKR
jgi:membrane protein implicated in regulation of membrane protease activity